MEYLVTFLGLIIIVLGILGINKLLNSRKHEPGFEEQLLQNEQKIDFENMKKDNKFLHLMIHVNAEHRTTFENPLDEDTYKIIYAVKMTFSGIVLKFNDENARYLIVYLRSANNKLQYTFDMKQNKIQETKMNNIVFNAAVPQFFREIPVY